MKNLVTALTLGLVLALGAAAADLTYEKIGAPAEAPAALQSLMNAEGYAVKGPDGKVIGEYWGRKDAFEGQASSGFGIRYDFIPEGSVIALVRLPDSGTDFRAQSVPGGWYTLRYALHPEDGNHMGVAPSRDSPC